MKYVDYHYKQSALDFQDEIEYGYNFTSNSKRTFNEDNLFLKPKIAVNKNFINTKRQRNYLFFCIIRSEVEK